jgi:fucose permease
MSVFGGRRPVAVGVLGCLAFVLIGWTGLLVPSLIRSIREAFGQSDAGMGLFYFLFAASYAGGSLLGGAATERLGRRVVLGAAAAIHGSGLLVLGFAPAWALVLVAAVPFGLGGGAIDGGVNGLFLDRFREGRGRMLNLLHLFFSVGALSAPLVIGQLLAGGVGWQAIVIGSAAAAFPVAALFALVEMPQGRRARIPAAVADIPPSGRRPHLPSLTGPLALLAIAIGCYVASEVGVSNWLVRFLEPTPVEVATLALSLYWAGLAVGRLVSARLADRFDHTAFATTAVVAMSAALLAAILVPSVPVSIALFAVAGFASGPIFPMIVAIGGDLYPERSAAVGGLLSGTAVAGSVVYPPIMGFLGLLCAALLLAAGRRRRRDPAAATA